MLTRADLEKREYDFLAPYAVKAAESSGRDRAEKPHAYRTCFQRDRDRIVHCSSFRRLEYKTQVFVNHEGDNYRTRLTHTMEVAQIARSIARTMRLNEDFAEALSLAHDLGHTPFGHAGEDALNGIMAADGGFEHNRQSRRIVTVLENNFHGLNLTREVTDSIIKHRTPYDQAGPGSQGALLETQVVNLADEISYNCHDLDDGIAAGILDVAGLEKLALWLMAAECVRKEHPDLEGSWHTKRAIVEVLNLSVTDLIETSERSIAKAGIATVEAVRRAPADLVGFSPAMTEHNARLQAFLRDNLYRHSRINRMSHKARRFIREIFAEYELHPESLPEDYQAWARQPGVGLRRAIADYTAGMTDRYAQEEYLRLFEPYK
jgi:dGTPase